MTKRIPWDEYEAAYLLNNCIKVQNGEISRKEAVSRVSKDLRKRAVSLGMKIDKTFRNKAGIEMQMHLMESCYLGKPSKLRGISKIFQEIVVIYKSDRKAFEKILNVSKDKLENGKEKQNNKNTKKKDQSSGLSFKEWMIEVKKLARHTGGSYVRGLLICEQLAANLDLTSTKILDVSPDIAKETIRVLGEREEYVKENERQHHRLSAAITKYLEYISEGKKSGEEFIPADTQNFVNTISKEIYLRYTEILNKYFSENGFRLGHPIFIGRLRNYYESEYGNSPAESDKQIESILKEIGTTRDGCIFPKQGEKADNLVNNITADIMSVFNAGIKCISVETVYEKYKKELADYLKIYNENGFVQVVLSAAKGNFNKKKSWFIQAGQSVDINPSVAENIMHIMKESYEPLSYDEIHKKAWYIPIDKIKEVLSREKAIVNVDAETYFYAPNLPINADEISLLIKVINRELSYKHYITGNELQELIENQVRSIAVNTGAFTEYGLRNCLGYILKNQFSFNGPIISKAGQYLSMKEVYVGFARSRDVLNITELKQFSKEVGVAIYWDAILKEKIRISKECMVSKEKIHFNVEKIDEILESICTEEYIPITKVKLFLHFPKIDYSWKWNNYVLESYLYNYSKKFRLVHASFAQDSVYGAIVRASSPISDYRTLIVDVLSRSDALGSAKQALQHLVDCGYQKLRRYEGIDDLIYEAKLLKINRKKIIETRNINV